MTALIPSLAPQLQPLGQEWPKLQQPVGPAGFLAARRRSRRRRRSLIPAARALPPKKVAVKKASSEKGSR